MEHVHPGSEIVTVTDGADPAEKSRVTYKDLASRIKSLVEGLRRDVGLLPQESILVLGWNDQEHLEVLLGGALAGCIVNSVNVRLGREVMDYLVNQVPPAAVIINGSLFSDPAVSSDVSAVVSRLEQAGLPIFSYKDPSIHINGNAVGAYEALLGNSHSSESDHWPQDENSTAFVFHTSGSTGRPKSYHVSHRAAMLHCLSQATADAAGLTATDRILQLVPNFHVNGWGLPLTCLMTGASQIMIGGDLRPRRVASVMVTEQVTVSAAVPTVWHDVCQAVENGEANSPQALREVLTGGSLVPKPVVEKIRKLLGASVATAWGMTETMACSTYERMHPETAVGKPIPLIELAIEDNDNHPAEDEAPPGRLLARGPFVIGRLNEEGWCATNDIAGIGADGVITLRDRETDLIKSGGEWIVSAELEQHLCTYAGVESAVVVGVDDPRWIERPYAYITLQQGTCAVSDLEQKLIDHITDKFPKWWAPDRIIVLDSMPTTQVGKIDKKQIKLLARTNTVEG
jgi:fatty-acyl-CoA synthase